jgi:hypothetical protein
VDIYITVNQVNNLINKNTENDGVLCWKRAFMSERAFFLLKIGDSDKKKSPQVGCELGGKKS